MTSNPHDMAGNGWLVHDIALGLLSGAGAGSIIGLLIAVRVSDSNIPTLIGAIMGAGLAIFLLMRSHQRAERFLTPTVVIAWIVLIASALFIGLLVSAIANFT